VNSYFFNVPLDNTERRGHSGEKKAYSLCGVGEKRSAKKSVKRRGGYAIE
jgi:hypothetical protein